MAYHLRGFYCFQKHIFEIFWATKLYTNFWKIIAMLFHVKKRAMEAVRTSENVGQFIPDYMA
jgi:hypothetical protein